MYNAFPISLRQEVLKVVAALPLNNNIWLADGSIHWVNNLIHDNSQAVILNGEELIIPSRVYFDEPGPSTEKELSAIQKTILNCIYLRHHNGFVRQKRLEQLIDNAEYFVIPFTFQLLGEYVVEILEVLRKHVNSVTISNYAHFINENKKYWQQTESRMISYWDAYYRRTGFPILKNYIGKQIIEDIKKAGTAL